MEGHQLEFNFLEEKTNKRQITLVLDIEDKDRSKWIWESHLNKNNDLGVNILSIHEGDLNEKNMLLEDLVTEIRDNAVIENSFFDRIEETLDKIDTI